MGIIIRQGAKSLSANMIGIVLGAFCVLWLFPKYLTLSQIGLITTLEGASLLASSLSSLGINAIVDKFYPVYKNSATKHHGYFGFLLFYTAFSWLLLGVFFAFTYHFFLSFYLPKSPEFALYFYLVFPFAGLLAFQNALEGFARVHFRTAIPAFFREVILRILIIVSVLFFTFGYYDFLTLIYFRLFSYAIVCGLLIIYLLRLGVPIFYFHFSYFTFARIWEILRYGLFIFLGSVSAILILKIDILMLGSMLNQEAVAIFGMAYFVGSIIDLPRKAISQISLPLIGQAWKDNDLTMLQKIYHQSSLNQLIVGLWFFLGIWINIDNLFALMPKGNIFLAGKYVILFVALTRLIDMGMGLNNEIIYQSSHYIFNLFMVLALLILVIIFNYIFIPIYNIIGVAFGTFLAVFLMNVSRFIFLYLKYKFQPFKIQHLWVVMVAININYLFSSWFISSGIIFWDLCWRSTLLTLMYWTVVLLAKISPEISKGFEELKKIVFKR